jgi:hypothetical protein
MRQSRTIGMSLRISSEYAGVLSEVPIVESEVCDGKVSVSTENKGSRMSTKPNMSIHTGPRTLPRVSTVYLYMDI